MSKPISCDTYDYIEIACLYHYDVCFELSNKAVVCGKAHNTVVLPNNAEAIELRRGEVSIKLALSEIVSMNVATPNARFEQVVFVSD